ncbi:MAG TPA: ComEC/Rec2 family competence protein [Candidatus Limnocylindrales bacterium]|nr:ComEC/Rec2 family competence protein [Candidatus Limnocylindrales bacterium]
MSALCLACCAVIAAFRCRAPVAQVAAALALMNVGSFARVYTPSPVITVPPQEFIGSDTVEIEGHVIADGAILAGGTPRERFDLIAESMQLQHREFTQPVRMRMTLYPPRSGEQQTFISKQGLPRLFYGDHVSLVATLLLPRNFGNPGAFDYEGYLHGLGIGVIGFAKAEHVNVLPETPGKYGTRLGVWRSRMRRSILEHIGGKASGLWKREDAALFAAMTLGDDSMLLRDVREDFQKTGIYHLLVVSGMNVGLLAFAVFWLARRLHAPKWAASLVTIALAVFYAYIAGLGVPIQRAVLMLSLFLAARLLYRGRASLNATGFAALVVLVISPQALYEAGFQLTFLALLAISGIGLPLLERSSERYRRALGHFDSSAYDLTLEPRLAQVRLDLRLVAGRLAKFVGARPANWLLLGAAKCVISLYELVVVSAVTQAVIVLPMRIYFHRAAIIGLPANILVLPLAGVMLNAGVAAIALSYLWLPPARIAAWAATAALHWTLACLGSLSRLHISQWRAPEPGLALWLVAALSIATGLAAVRARRALALAGMAILFACAAFVGLYNAAPALIPNRLEITAIDVGQGDSILLVSPDGHTMLVDAGGSIGPAHSEFDFGEDVVSPYLWSRGLEHLDVVVLTHAHGDHIGGLARVIENFHPAELWLGINPSTPALENVLQVAAANHVTLQKHIAGDGFPWGGAQVRVLSPPADWRPRSRPGNDDSLTFLISYGHTSALLAGDLEKKMEDFVAGESPHADVLKVAHHGSATSTTPELLAAFQPHFAVISVGYRNQFGHPRMEVLQRLQQDHVRTYRTDMLGAVTFLLDGKSVSAQTPLR